MKRCLLCMLMLMILVAALVSCGKAKETTTPPPVTTTAPVTTPEPDRTFWQWYDYFGMTDSMGQGAFIDLLDRYTYQEKPLSDSRNLMHWDNEFGGGCIFEVQGVLSASNSYQISADSTYADYYNTIAFTALPDRLYLPYNIPFDGELSLLLTKLDLLFDYQNAFVSDQDTPGVMTLSQKQIGNREEKIQLLNLNQSSDWSQMTTAYRLIYTASYSTYSNHAVRIDHVRRVTMDFEGSRALLKRAELRIDEKTIYGAPSFSDSISAMGLFVQMPQEYLFSLYQSFRYQGKGLMIYDKTAGVDGIEVLQAKSDSRVILGKESKYREVENSLRFFAPVDNKVLPYNISFGDSLATVLEKLDLAFDYVNAFQSDEETPGVMTLKKDSLPTVQKSLVLVDTVLCEDEEAPERYRLIYSDRYEIENGNGGKIEVTRSVTVTFDREEHKATDVSFSICEYSELP